MKTTVGELRTLIRETIEGSTEEDVQAKLAAFDQQTESLRSATERNYQFEFELDGMKFMGFYSRTEPKSKAYSMYVDGYQVGTAKSAADAFSIARKKYESKVRKELKVKVDPSVKAASKAADAASKAEREHNRDVAATWKNGHMSAMADSNGKHFDPNKRFR